ncbi:MAG: MFS transporter [Gammaproteobacteria bacterium]|nr:MFS transporter [Gammaproteobacteria bacterium]
MHDENLKSDAVVEAVKDVKQLGLIASIASLSYVFWVVGGMEMVERLAYYAVRSVSGIYATTAQSEGGLGITPTQLGTIFLAWSVVQSLVPVFTGGLSDRYGYKETIFVSTVLKMGAYVIMAMYPTYEGFFVGAIVLALGTGIFKPGIQGTLVLATDRTNSSMAWGIFYQTVNIGAAIAPMLAGFLRQMDWQFVFIACAIIIAGNFLLLLTYKEIGKEERLARRAAGNQESLVRESLRELKRPVLLLYLIVFSGFWFMFMSLFDVLPIHIAEWVDTSTIVSTFWSEGEQPGGLISKILVLNSEGTAVLPEGLVNINALMIMTSCFVFAWLSSKLKALTSITAGTLLCSAALMIIGGFNFAWFIALAIFIFSTGEMISSPKFSEYLGNMAPSDKKAMYLGFSQFPLFIGWSLESFLGPLMYDHWASKDRISRAFLEDNGWGAEAIEAVPIGEAFYRAVDVSGMSSLELQEAMYQANDIGLVWFVMGFVGVLSAFGMALYANWLKRLQANAV